MRVRDIEAGNEYATCDGGLVVPQDPVVKEYVRAYDSKTATHSIIRLEKTDPWGGCGDARRPVTMGNRCLRYDADREGKRVGDGDDVVVDPRDVKGTWHEYLTLHAAKVREIADRRSWEQRLDSMRQAFSAAVADVFPGETRTRVSPVWGKKTIDTIDHVNVDIMVKTRDQWDALVRFIEANTQDVFPDEMYRIREYLPVKEAE